MKTLVLFFFAVVCCTANNTCALNVGTAAHYTFSTTVASDWTNCGGTTPQAGDNISISGTAHTFTIDVAHTFGNGQNPFTGYPASITGSYTGGTCGSAPSLGGTSVNGNVSASLGCHVVAGNCTPYISMRGWYSAAGTTNISSYCSGGSGAWTLNWNTGGGQPAVLAGAGTSIIIAAPIIARGDVTAYDSYGDLTPGLTLTSTGGVTFDFSLSASTTNMYSFGNQGNPGASWSRAFQTDTSCGSGQCSYITTTSGGAWRIGVGGQNIGPIIDFEHMALSNCGDATEPWVYYMTARGTYGPLTLKFDTLNNCSTAEVFTVESPGEVIDVENNRFSNTIPANIYGIAALNFHMGFPSAADGSVKTIINNSSDAAIFFSSYVSGILFKGNYFGGSLNGVNDTATPWVADNNFFVGHSQSDGGNSYSVPGDFTHSVFLNMDATANWHVFLDWTMVRNSVEQYNVLGVAVANSGDSGEISQNPQSSSYSTTFDNNIVLPDPSGHSWSEPSGSIGRPGTQISDHNYWYADYGASNPAFGFIQTDEGGTATSGIVASMRCNTMWNPVDQLSFVKLNDQLGGGPVQNLAASGSLMDYNWGRGSSPTQVSACSGCTGQTNGYVGYFSNGSPGQHDNNTIDPGIDYKRVIEAFASDYLHATASRGAWSGSNTYAQGDTVSSSVSGVYWSKSLIYNCYAAAGCTSAPQPGGSGAWYSSWEPYTLTWLKVNIPAGTTLVDGALQVFGIGEDTACTTASPCDPITALRHWIFAGHIPSNPQFAGACAMDGKAIGPVDAVPNRRPTLPVLVN